MLVLHTSAMRTVGEAEALSALDETERQQPRRVVMLDMRPFVEEVEGGVWRGGHAYIRTKAAEIAAAVDELTHSQEHYFGIVEIPHAVALGAYHGDERRVELHDYDRDHHSWTWPTTTATIRLEILGVPSEFVDQGGAAVIRVAISSVISDQQVAEVVSSERVADITITPASRLEPAICTVRSAADVSLVRQVFRAALAALVAHRPRVEVIHLFIAAPVSVCFAIGQELRLRNTKPVQTYRFRSQRGEPSYSPAIRLVAAGLLDTEAPLTDRQRALAEDHRRVVWPETLASVVDYARTLTPDSGHHQSRWYEGLVLGSAISEAAPWPSLPPLRALVGTEHRVSQEPRASDYGFDKDAGVWRVSDRMLERFSSVTGGASTHHRDLIRLFFFHEYLHDWQHLTKYTASAVGRFPNSLERIDYVADAFAAVHQADYVIRQHATRTWNDQAHQTLLADQIDLAVRSFWAFEEPAPWYDWQERRVRRYLNWFWRRVQIRRAPGLRTALRVLFRQPAIEISGLRHKTDGGRVLVTLNQVRLGERLEVGLVLEDGRFWRSSSVGDLQIEDAMGALARHDHDALGVFFNSLYEMVSATRGGLPQD